MAKIQQHLSTQERDVRMILILILILRTDPCFIRFVAKLLCRVASTINRELKRTSGTYHAIRLRVTRWNEAVFDREFSAQ